MVKRELQKKHTHTHKKNTKQTNKKTHTHTHKKRATVRYHFTPVRMTVIKNTQTVHAGEDMEKREPSCTVGGNIN